MKILKFAHDLYDCTNVNASVFLKYYFSCNWKAFRQQ